MVDYDGRGARAASFGFDKHHFICRHKRAQLAQIFHPIPLTARDAALGVVVTSLLDGAVGVSHAAHLASAIGALHPAPGLGTSALVAVDVGTPPRLEGGFLLLSGEDGP